MLEVKINWTSLLFCIIIMINVIGNLCYLDFSIAIDYQYGVYHKNHIYTENSLNYIFFLLRFVLCV